MRKALLVAACALLTTSIVQAHFVFVVPAANGSAVSVVFSEDLLPDEAVDAAKIAGLKLQARDEAGKVSPVALKAGKHELTAELPGKGPRVLFGTVNYGVMQKGEDKPYLLAYHPKALVGAVATKQALVGQALPAELLVMAEVGKVRFQLLGSGKPVPEAEVTIIKPDGSKVKVKTGADGITEPVEGVGRFAAWVRFTEPKSGELDGKKYEEVRHYATLVADVAAR